MVVAVDRHAVRVRRVAADGGTEQQVGVPADELGRRVQDDVRAELERTLAQRRRERRIDHRERAALAGAGGDRRDVRDDDQRVRDRLDPDHVGALGRREDGGGVVGRGQADVSRPCACRRSKMFRTPK